MVIVCNASQEIATRMAEFGILCRLISIVFSSVLVSVSNLELCRQANYI